MHEQRDIRYIPMDIRQLRYFNTVAHLENISKAADFLHISQSALSKQIQHLEHELGTPLFDRRGKKIVLNKAGMRFYDSSELILREMQSARDDIDMLVSRKDYRIRIGTAGTPEKWPECLGQFARLHPETVFVLNSRIEYEEHIDINQYDALICPDEFRFERLNGYPLYEESYFFAVSRKNAHASDELFHLQMLKDQPLVFMQGESFYPEFPYRVCTATGMDPGTFFFSDSRQFHRQLIAADQAAGFVPRSESAGYACDPDIRLLKILDKRFNRFMKLCFLREKHLSELGLQFRNFVFQFFKLEHLDDPDVQKSQTSC